MAENNTGSYREKYLQALKDQERLEKQLGFQLDLMKKTALQLASAASGLDMQVDASVGRLREVMRGGTGPQVIDQMERIKAAVENFEHSRDSENLKAAKVMSKFIEQYQSLQIPADIKTSLKSYSQSLKQRLTNYRQYPAALEDLANLQQLALDAASSPQATLWTRLKGGKTLATLTDETASSVKDSTSKTKESIDINEKEGAQARRRAEQARASNADASTLAVDEDSYKEVSQRIASTLSNLVKNIDPNDAIRHRIDIVRHRIERGMDWYVLAVTLEDIRDILFLRYVQADEEFSVYLSHVHQELGSIREALTATVEGDKKSSEHAEAFADTVSSGVDRIRDSVEANSNVDELKKEVNEHILYISDALSSFKSNQQNTLTEQLQSLVNHVQNVEKESEKTKEALEEQRHKATHDPLTELANREGYAERAFHELQRFQRYGRPLTLAICDIDFFKKINDGYGHQAGDKVLRLIAKVISTRLRNVDFIARFGGEEFVILMPETNVDQSFKVLDKIRAAVGKTAFRFKDAPVQITISFGLAEFVKSDSIESVFERADKALYQAKDEGRNRCIIAPEPKE